MKISKLFHWLYAIVMLLPIFAIGVTCGYVIFNKNAYKSFTKSNVETISLISNTNQFQEGLVYIAQYEANKESVNAYGAWIEYNDISIDWTNYNVNYQNIVMFRLFSSGLIQIRDNNNTQYAINNTWGNTLTSFSFNFKSSNFESWTNGKVNYYLPTYVEAQLENVFYYSVDKVTQSSYFSWSYNSFLVTPFTYIVNLFGMPVDSPVVMLLSYWLDISIIWLVFDMVMYVPLLVHRWLDKGVLE